MATSSAVPGLVDTLFQRSLDDLIKALRSHPAGESTLISRSITEIRREIRSTDPSTKSVALQKLAYLSSLHFLDASWASFHALELLPSPSLPLKRLAYLAASLSLPPSSPLLLLATNQLRKDLSPSPFLPSLPLEFLSVAASPDLARDLTPEVHALLSHPNPSIRSRAIAAAFRVLTLCPDSVRVSFKRLVDNLDASADPRVVSAAVSVFCELSASDPGPYLPLAPEFYRILVDSRNNWVLIKVLKIFARLAPLEPRLARRVVDPICEHMRRSNAKSLVFECVRTVATSLADFDHAVALAAEKMREFLTSESDPNLRYLGLQALVMLGPRHSWAVEENREVVIKSLSDPDPNIRREGLRLIMGTVFESNVVETSELLLGYAAKSDPEFSNEILEAILSTCGRNVYELVEDFDWYVALLGDMVRTLHCAKGEEIERQLVDIGFRVRDARAELVRVARDLLIDPALLGNPFLCRILSAAAWVSGEYVEFSRNPIELVEALLQPRTNLLPRLVRAVYIHAVSKVLSFCFSFYLESLEAGQMPLLGNSIAGMKSPEEESNIATIQLETDENIGVQRRIEHRGINEGGPTVCEPTCSLGSVEAKGPFTRDSILKMMNLIETAMTPLADCGEVEVQERVRSILSLIHMLREFRDWKMEDEGIGKESRVNEIVKLMRSAFSGELGPVSASAQERVAVPVGLILKENLSDLTIVLGEESIATSSSVSFSRQRRHEGETGEESMLSTESTSLLAEHRKRHGLYYLPAERDEIKFDNYPPANEPLLLDNKGNSAAGLVKQTGQSVFSRKTKPPKPRPVVIQLDEGNANQDSGLKPTKDLKNELLSGAVQDVLGDGEDKLTSSQKRSTRKSSQKMVRNPSIYGDSSSHSKETVNVGDIGPEGASSRSSKHHRHKKERQKSPHRNEGIEERSHRNLKKSDRHHRKHKNRQQGDANSMVVPQTPVIQDFLL